MPRLLSPWRENSKTTLTVMKLSSGKTSIFPVKLKTIMGRRIFGQALAQKQRVRVEQNQTY